MSEFNARLQFLKILKQYHYNLQASEFNARLQQTRTKLLDLTKRNKLISYKKPAQSRHLKIIDESPDFIYHRLVVEEGQFKFKYIPETHKNKNANKDVLVKKTDEKETSVKNLADALEDSNSNVLLIIDNLDDIKEHPVVKLNLFEELQEEKIEQIHSENDLRQSSYKQGFVSDEKLKDLLMQLRDEEVAKEFDIKSPRCILSKIMIDQFVKQKPKDMDEFRFKIKQQLRENIDSNQVKFLSMIFDIIEMADE